MTIRSLLGIHRDLAAKHVKYILTSRFNQDCLENLFSQIRGLGNFYDNPLPSEVKNRLRLLITEVNAGHIPVTRSPFALADDNSYVTTHLFESVVKENDSETELTSALDEEKEIRDILEDFVGLVNDNTTSPMVQCKRVAYPRMKRRTEKKMSRTLRMTLKTPPPTRKRPVVTNGLPTRLLPVEDPLDHNGPSVYRQDTV